jgi:tetratricopeptide (TPR) repeat protein
MNDDDQPPAYVCTGPERHSWLDPDDAAKCCNGYVRESRVARGAQSARLEFYWRAQDGRHDDDLRPVHEIPLGEVRRDGVAHVVFFERLARFADAVSAEWKAVVAGLLTMRLIDRFVASPARAREPTFREFHWVRSAVDELEPERVRDTLRALLDNAQAGNAGAITDLLFAYAGRLEDTAEWSLAADVYGTIIAHAKPLRERGRQPWAYNRLGYCHRQLGDLRAASRAFRRGRNVARAMGDAVSVLRIRVSEANLVIHRGNLPLASRRLDQIIADARAGQHWEPLAMALHDRGGLACDRGRPGDAVSYLFEALERYTDVAHQQRVLGDLARALAAIGCTDAARDALTVVFQCADDRDCRWAAAINLLEIASLAGDDAAFERYCRLVSAEALPARMTASYLLRLAEAHQRAGRLGESAAAYRRLLAHAEQHTLNEYVVVADSGIAGLHRLDPIPAVRPAPIIAQVSAFLHARRQALAAATD